MPRSRKNKVINVLMPPNVEVRLQAIMDAYRTSSMSHAVRIAIEQTAEMVYIRNKQIEKQAQAAKEAKDVNDAIEDYIIEHAKDSF